MTDRVLDWRPNPDPMNAMFLVSTMDCFRLGPERRNIKRTKSVFLDQGQEGACTGFGCAHVIASSPHPLPVNQGLAQDIYHEARRQDEWEGEDYEGSSVNGAMKAARAFGYVREWRWCYSLPEVRHALSYHGPVEAGTWWYSGMWDTDSDGMIHVAGDQVGGHAYDVSGFRTNADGTRDYRMENSWGADWGDHGGAWISEFDMLQLLTGDGEFACPLKVRMIP